jgi:hypothetical protein
MYIDYLLLPLSYAFLSSFPDILKLQNFSNLFSTFFSFLFFFLSKKRILNFEDEILIRRGECNNSNKTNPF